MKTDRPSQIEDHLGYWLRCLSNLVSESFAERLEKHGVSVPQWVVLRSLFDAENATLNQLASTVDVDNGALSRMVERLQRKGLLVREADPADRRTVRLRLSTPGKKLVPVLASEADDNDGAFFGVLEEQERRRLLETVRTLLDKNGWRGKGLNRGRTMDHAVLHECLSDAFAGRSTFPETVERMLATGVERYDADLTRLEKLHYGTDGSTHVEAIPLEAAPVIPIDFSSEKVRAAIEASRRREILYPEFLRRIMGAGTAGYSVYLNGRKAIYFGRDGEFHVEPFS